MKRVALVILLMIWLSANFVFAQRTKNEAFDFKYVQEPLFGLPEHIKTYNVVIKPGSNQQLGNVDFTFIRYTKQSAWYSAGSSSNYGSVELAQQEFLNLYGYERAADADLISEAWFEPLIIKSKKQVYYENCSSISKPCYAYDLTFNYGAGFRLTDKAGNVLMDTTIFDPNKDYRAWFGVASGLADDVIRFKENNDMTFAYPSSGELEQRFQNSLESIKAEMTRDQLLHAEEIINNRYGYPVKEYKVGLTTGRSRKNRNYDEDANDKDARIFNDLAHGLLFNIGITSIWLGEWEVVDNLEQRAAGLSQDRSYAAKLVEFKNQRKSRIENYKAVKSND